MNLIHSCLVVVLISINMKHRQLFCHFISILAFVLCQVALVTKVRAQTALAELSGQNPFGIRWYEISDSNFRVIFPQGSERVAQHVLNTLRIARGPVSQSLDAKLRKLSVVIQAQNTDNNGFVSGGPRRAEFYNTPPQNPSGLGLNDWFEELCVHEYRHIVQLDNANQGWGKFLNAIFGNTGTVIAEGITNPWWFWEGDAVGCETVFGFGGRGRLPSFDATLRMQLLSHQKISYTRAVCGSMKRMVPNHYVLGYYMTSYVKNHYGIYAWDTILSKSYHRIPLPATFSHCTKKVTGKKLKQVYADMTRELTDSALLRYRTSDTFPAHYIHQPNQKFFTQYRFPCAMPNGTVVAMKSGLGDGGLVAYKSASLDFAKLVVIEKDSSEKTLCMTGVLDDNGRMGSGGQKIVWTESTYDPRWGARNYCDIFMYDLGRHKRIRITRQQRLHAPDISENGNLICAVEWNTKSECFLVLINPETGQISKRFANPGNAFCLQPTFAEQDKSIVFLKSKPGYKSIWKLDIATGTETELVPWIGENLGAPELRGSVVFYNSTESGIDNIYAVNVETGSRYMVTNRPFGAYHPAITADGKHLLFYDLQPKGALIASMDNDSGKWKKMESVKVRGRIRYFNGYIHQEGGNILTAIPKDSFAVKRFHRLKNSLNIYGWGYQLSSSSPDIRVGINSQDLISTTQLNAGLAWDRNERNFGKYASLRYLGFYPVLSLSYIDGSRHDLYSFREGKKVFDSSSKYHFQTTDFTVAIPFNFSVGKFIKKMNISAAAFFTTISKHDVFSNEYYKEPREAFYGTRYNFSYQVAMRQAIRDVAPRLGYGIDVIYQHTPFGSSVQASQFAADAQVLLPGITRHDAFRFRGMFQNNWQDNYYFKNAYFFVRGIQNTLSHQLWIGTAEYKFPLVYPDANLLDLIYVQRARTTLFTDYGRAFLTYTDPTQPPYLGYQYFQSVGIEQTFDCNILRFLIPVNMGIRSSWDVRRNTWNFQFLFSVIGY